MSSKLIVVQALDEKRSELLKRIENEIKDTDVEDFIWHLSQDYKQEYTDNLIETINRLKQENNK